MSNQFDGLPVQGAVLHLDAEQGFRVDVADDVATLWMKMPGPTNVINARFGAGFQAALAAAKAHAGLKGLIVASGHREFCAGADLEFIYQCRDPEALYALVNTLHTTLRALETAGIPVVAAIAGPALGGGYELALACHHRVALDAPNVQVGLPEVSLGVIPGGGGTQRLPRLVGLQKAVEAIAQGQILRAGPALKARFVDALAPDLAGVFAAARQYIAANPKARQPWDARDFQWPGGVQPDTAAARNLFAAGAAMLVQKTAGAYPAPEAAVQAVYEGALLGFDAALRVEADLFVARVISDQAKDMIRTFFFHRTAVEKQVGLPRLAADEDAQGGIHTVAVLGAGMMGAGLAFVAAQRGCTVVLKDISQEALDKGREHIAGQVAKRAKHLSADEKQALLDRVTFTLDVADLADADLVIEAVFENLALKHRVIAETEAVLKPGAIFASNTSALPIDDLAKASKNPSHFIGLHYFSPVEQMPLVEVIKGAATSEHTLARCLAFCRRTKKTAVVVNDGFGFYTTRVFSAYILEGAEAVAEGHDPVIVERAAQAAGMVVPPLKVFDEVTLSLGAKAIAMREQYQGAALDLPGVRLIKAMVAAERLGKAAGAGFYDYASKPRRLWSGLAAAATEARGGQPGVEPQGTPPEQAKALGERLLLIQALEAVRALEGGVLRSARDGDLAAILGVGFAPNTGGPFAWLDRHDLKALVARLDALAAEGVERFKCPDLLRKMAGAGERFYPAV